jgi:hypothetical protein
MIHWLVKVILWPFHIIWKALGYPGRWLKKVLSALFRGFRERLAGFPLKKRNKNETRKEEF